LPDRTSPKPRRSMLGFAFFVVAGGGIAAWLALFLLINPEKLRDQLDVALVRATGRDVRLDGPVHLSFGLNPSFSVENVAIGNIEGGSRPDMLTAKRVVASVSLMSLITGNPAIGSVWLDQPDLLLERDDQGNANWHLGGLHRIAPVVSPPPAAPSQSPSPSPGESPIARHVAPAALPITSITATGGQISYRMTATHTVTLAISSMSIATNGIDAPVSVQIDGTLTELPITVRAQFGSIERLSTRPLRGLAGPWPIDLNIAGGFGTITVQGGLTHPETGRGFTARITADADDTSPMAALLGIDNAVALKKFHLDARVEDGPDGTPHTEQVTITAGATDLGSRVPGLGIDHASLTAPGPGQLAQLAVDGMYRDTKLQVAGTLMQPEAFSATAPLAVSLNAAALGASITAHGTVPPSWNEGGVDLQLSGSAPDLGALAPLLGVSLPNLRDAQFSAHATDAGFRLTGVSLQGLALKSNAGNIDGDITLHWSPKWNIAGKLAGDHLVFDGLALVAPPPPPALNPPLAPAPAPAAPAPDATASAAEVHMIPDDPLPFSALKNIDLDLDLSALEITVDGEVWRDAGGHVALADGKLAINPLRAVSPDGALVGALIIDSTVTPPHVALSLSAPAMAAQGITKLFGFTNGAGGMVQIDAKLSATGDTAHSLAANLGGHLGLSLVNGQISGELLQATLGDVLASRGVTNYEGGSVRCFATKLDFTSGVGQFRALALDQSKLSLTGTGEIDLGAETIDLHLKPSVKLGSVVVAAPVSAVGGFRSAKISLDPVIDGNRVGITIGGAVDEAQNPCIAQLAIARDGQSGPMPAAAPPETEKKKKKPVDLMQMILKNLH